MKISFSYYLYSLVIFNYLNNDKWECRFSDISKMKLFNLIYTFQDYSKDINISFSWLHRRNYFHTYKCSFRVYNYYFTFKTTINMMLNLFLQFSEAAHKFV
jgi:hypothetical protein